MTLSYQQVKSKQSMRRILVSVIGGLCECVSWASCSVVYFVYGSCDNKIFKHEKKGRLKGAPILLKGCFLYHFINLQGCKQISLQVDVPEI